MCDGRTRQSDLDDDARPDRWHEPGGLLAGEGLGDEEKHRWDEHLATRAHRQLVCCSGTDHAVEIAEAEPDHPEPGAVLQSVYTWRGELKAESLSTPVVGAASAVSYGKHQFEMCGLFKFGPFCNTDEVDSEITFTAKGGATCKSSAGPVRNCVIKTA